MLTDSYLLQLGLGKAKKQKCRAANFDKKRTKKWPRLGTTPGLAAGLVAAAWGGPVGRMKAR
jgi:hypothetical protein